jgi:hypothetical protein
MARATTGDILSLLREAGASDEDASRVVTALESAGLNPRRCAPGFLTRRARIQ